MSEGEDHLRAGDADRERAVAELHSHHGAGRLSLGDLETRVAAAYAAVTWGDLSEIFVDLPGRKPAPGASSGAAPSTASAIPPPAVRPRVGAPGRGSFTYSGTLPAPVQVTARRAVQHLGPSLQAAGYHLTAQSDERVTFTARRIPGWAWLPAIMVPGPGFLVPLLARRERVEIHLDFEPTGTGGTRMVAHGMAPRRVRRALSGLVS